MSLVRVNAMHVVGCKNSVSLTSFTHQRKWTNISYTCMFVRLFTGVISCIICQLLCSHSHDSVGSLQVHLEMKISAIVQPIEHCNLICCRGRYAG